MSDDGDLTWPADSVAPSTGATAAGAARDVRSLLSPSMRRGSDVAVAALGATLRPRERPVSVLSGHLEGERRRDRGRLILVTEQRVLIADPKAGSVMAWAWHEIDSFSTRGSNAVVLSACTYVFRFGDGSRVTLANVGPHRRGFTAGRRIAWHVRASKLPGSALRRRWTAR